MKEDLRNFSLQNRDRSSAAAPVLAGVQATGRVDGPLFEMTLRQTYRNDGDRVLEVVYTFPLPPQAVLLGFASELNGRRQVGTVVPRSQAERTYERSLARGDAPVMLEALADGLHTANIGNLKPGDELVLEVRLAQTLAVEQGHLRLALPMTIAPRYGSAEAAGLQPQQVPVVSAFAEYPLSVSITIAGALADADIDCPTHACQRTEVAGGVRLDLRPGAWLDRDLVVVVQPRGPWPSLVVQAADARDEAAPRVRMASLRVPTAPRRHAIALKVLVDCSGSMGGDSIASARTALQAALDTLTPVDGLSISRFGSGVEHVLPAAIGHDRDRLRRAVAGLEADLGGTETTAALTEVLGLRMPRGGFDRVDVLLITDGEVWQADALIAAARAGGHRVFAIGVGAAPAEGLLRRLAEATGGACEMATPGEALEAAADRMMARIRQHPWTRHHIDWGGRPVWQTELPQALFGGDTVVAFAGLPPAAHHDEAMVRLVAHDVLHAQAELCCVQVPAPIAGPTLARMAAARRLKGADRVDRVSLATRYQLMSADTHCILVHERADGDRATDEAELHRVTSMLAAGWGATGRVLYSRGLPAPSIWRAPRTDRLMSLVAPSSLQGPDDLIGPYELAFSDLARAGAPTNARRPASLGRVARVIAAHLANGGAVSNLAEVCRRLPIHPRIANAIAECQDGASLDPGTLWLLLAHWVMQRDGDTHAAARLRACLAAVDPDEADRCRDIFERLLGDADSGGWSTTRSARLRRALRKAIFDPL